MKQTFVSRSRHISFEVDIYFISPHSAHVEFELISRIFFIDSKTNEHIILQ
jgi:hypothetical protein